MKSLEIVNEKIGKHEKRIIDIQPIEEYIKGLHIIKQDLEVLEILKKYVFKDYKLEKIYGITIANCWLGIRDKYLNEVNFPIDDEDFNKLKQWWEVNKNDR